MLVLKDQLHLKPQICHRHLRYLNNLLYHHNNQSHLHLYNNRSQLHLYNNRSQLHQYNRLLLNYPQRLKLNQRIEQINKEKGEMIDGEEMKTEIMEKKEELK